ncbi:MAG: hypothetical protein ACLFU8_11005 [Anaerolineales bacterium]
MRRLRTLLQRFWLPALLVLLLAPLLVFPFRDLVRELIIVPLSYVAWFGDLLLQSLPPIFFWIIFLFIALRIALRSLRRPAPPAGEPEAPATLFPSPVELWAHRLRLTQVGRYSRWRLAHHLSELAAEILAHHQGLTPREARERIRDGAFEAPPEIHTYLHLGMSPQLLEGRDIVTRLLVRLGLHQEPPSPLDLDPERVIAFLEEELEVEHATTSVRAR